ncbi:MAG: hypothetical protein IJ767_00020 [Bacteroidaceae bacterium]|nr:hypothetical protein [Bacteroidaceae bacterium]
MEDTTEFIVSLRREIEAAVGRKMRTPKDFDFLSKAVFDKLHENISATTLKRLWGYFKENVTPRHSTLDFLAQFIDYAGWEDYCQQHSPQPAPQEIPASAATATAASASATATAASASATATTAASAASPSTPSAPGDFVAGSPTTHAARRWTAWYVAAALALVLIAIATGIYLSSGADTNANSTNNRYVLKQGQKFPSCGEYLSLFGIRSSDTPWHEPLPHHPSIAVWGPQYHNPNWHNDGNPDSLMPTITEYWEPTEIEDTLAVRTVLDKMNREGYYMSRRLNEVRITFMRDLIDSSYVFLGVYRFSLEHSDTTHIVWERVAKECDLSQLAYLEQLRN